MQPTQETRPDPRQPSPRLRNLVVEASRALARLDADRLEELALSCQALNRDLANASLQERSLLAMEARESSRDMAIFARVLEATRSNLSVMRRLRDLRREQLEYGGGEAPNWTVAGSQHGND